jgi:hypothetical protein
MMEALNQHGTLECKPLLGKQDNDGNFTLERIILFANRKMEALNQYGMYTIECKIYLARE